MRQETMGKLRIITLDDTVQSAAKMKHAIWQRFGFDCRLLDKQGSSIWIWQLPENYQWTSDDAEFMNNLVDQSDLVANWYYVKRDSNEQN